MFNRVTLNEWERDPRPIKSKCACVLRSVLRCVEGCDFMEKQLFGRRADALEIRAGSGRGGGAEEARLFGLWRCCGVKRYIA